MSIPVITSLHDGVKVVDPNTISLWVDNRLSPSVANRADSCELKDGSVEEVIMRLFDYDGGVRTEFQVFSSQWYRKPFCDMSAGRSRCIRRAIKRLLKRKFIIDIGNKANPAYKRVAR